MSTPSLSKEEDPWDIMSHMAVTNERTTSRMIARCFRLMARCERLIKDMENYAKTHEVSFGLVWSRVRTFISLQVRLVVEQVLWERGGKWRTYVTGFGPVDVKRTLTESERTRDLGQTLGERRSEATRVGAISPTKQLVSYKATSGYKQKMTRKTAYR